MKLQPIVFSLILLTAIAVDCNAQSKDYAVKSPNDQLSVSVRVGDSISYAVQLKNSPVILPSAIAMTLQDRVLGLSSKIKQVKRNTGHSQSTPLYGKSAKLSNDYNELILTFSDQYALEFRAYNEGIAYRFIPDVKDSMTVVSEKANFNFSGSPEGTRCHELAMFVVFDQPLAMLCDSPTEYEKYPDIMKFLSAVPTVFEETKVLDAKLGEYALMAKKKQGKWFVGAMNNWQSRTLKLDFSFLDDQTYTAEIYTDGGDANENAEHYIYKTIRVTRNTKIDLPLANGGGGCSLSAS